MHKEYLKKPETIDYDVEGQRVRRQHMYRQFSQIRNQYFTESGQFIGPEIGRLIRPADIIKYCFPYLGSGIPEAIQLANQIVRRLDMVVCHFLPFHSLQLLTMHSALLETDVKRKLEVYAKNSLDEFKGDDHDYVGVNDNFPCMSSYTLMVGGKMFDRPELYDRGKTRIGQLAGMLQRRGVPSEYLSPVYTVIQLNALACIAEHVEEQEIKEIALRCEERIWANYLGQFHVPAMRLAGPYSRTYTGNLTEQGYHPAVLYMLLGDKVKYHGFAAGGEGPFESYTKHVNNCLCVDFHCSEYLKEWFLNRKYPFHFEATTEYNSSTDGLVKLQKELSDNKELPDVEKDPMKQDEFYEYPSGSGRISTYMTEDYSLGVASQEWHCGNQTDTFIALYTRKKPILGQSDVGIVYARYIINDAIPGQINVYPELDVRNGANLTWDQGRKIGIHHERTAMMLYKPRLYTRKNVTSMRLMLVFPIREGEPEEIRLGDRTLENNVGESLEMCPVFIRDGHTYLAFHPLVPTHYGRSCAVKVEKNNGFLTISFYNYEGEKRSFSSRGYLLTGNGFVSEMGCAREDGTFTAFCKKVSDVGIYDEFLTNEHMRDTFVRKTVYKREGVTLACEYSPVSEGIRYMTANGRNVGDRKLEASGLDADKLPYMRD